jgi:serine/threonine-protein kinase RsbW
MEIAMECLTLEIESQLSNVSLLGIAIHAVSLHTGLDKVTASQVELSLVEAVTNAIRHAYHGEPNHRVIVTISFEKRRLRFDLWDFGTPMRPELIDRLIRGRGFIKTENLSLAAIAESGRGLEIIHRTMDEIVYKRDGDRNHLQLTRYLSTE